MKKVEIMVPLHNGGQAKVSGYEFELETGHVMVVHKTLNLGGLFWGVSFKENGVLFVDSCMTRQNAMFEAKWQAKKLGKEEIDKGLAKVAQSLSA